jgi:hypothetical protein
LPKKNRWADQLRRFQYAEVGGLFGLKVRNVSKPAGNMISDPERIGYDGQRRIDGTYRWEETRIRHV